MSDDVFGDWKSNRFIIAPGYLTDSKEHLIVLTDVGFWNTHYEELKDWCDEHLADTQGMTVAVPNERILTLFVLRWS